ncbi:MAG: sulfotransferase family 2 domain-containing protein [Bacteroidales bacterium]|nr:sulfotransferase family 2 domain-containing protein [Bacteroidales bacterium]
MILFTHIEKTAGTTFKSILFSNYGIHTVDANKTKKKIFTKKDLDQARRIFFGIQAVSGHNLSDPTRNIMAKNASLITILRDPYIRCASHYQDKVLRGNLEMSFKEWIQQKENQNFMVRSISGNADLQRAKELLKNDYFFTVFTERFNESLQLLNCLLEKPLRLKYKKLIVASSNDIKNKLLSDEKSLELLKKYNDLDRQLYDYVLKELYLPLLERHSDKLENEQPPVTGHDIKSQWKFKSGFLYNKFIYRQLIKLLR